MSQIEFVHPDILRDVAATCCRSVSEVAPAKTTILSDDSHDVTKAHLRRAPGTKRLFSRRRSRSVENLALLNRIRSKVPRYRLTKHPFQFSFASLFLFHVSISFSHHQLSFDCF